MPQRFDLVVAKTTTKYSKIWPPRLTIVWQL